MPTSLRLPQKKLQNCAYITRGLSRSKKGAYFALAREMFALKYLTSTEPSDTIESGQPMKRLCVCVRLFAYDSV